MKVAVFILLVLIAVVLGSLYGLLHDQVTFSLNRDFFYKVRFSSINFDPTKDAPRVAAALVGIQKTWPVGLVLGLAISVVGLIHRSSKKMFILSLQGFCIAFSLAALFTLIAVFTSESEVSMQGITRINNFGYVGGIIGMFIGIGWHAYKARRNREPSA